MLIKSQNGKVIVNTNTLVSLDVFDCKIYCKTTYSEEEYGYVIGTYDSDIEAQEELDKLFDAINEPKYDLGGKEISPESVHTDYASGEIPF